MGIRKWDGQECQKLSNDQYKELSEYMENFIGFYEPIKPQRIKTHDLFSNDLFNLPQSSFTETIILHERERKIRNDISERQLDHYINN